MDSYTREQALEKSIEYFNGDKLAADVFVKKYALSDGEKYYELTPEDMHKRLAKEFARIEKKYPNPMSEDEIFDLFDGFKYVCITKDTWITTSDGPRQVFELINKPFVAVVDGNLYKSTKEGFFQTSKSADVYEIITKEGYRLKATKNHKILVHKHENWWLKKRNTIWKTVEELKSNDRIVLHDHRKNWWTGAGNNEEGWLLGNLIGDGSWANEDKCSLVFQEVGCHKQNLKMALKLINENLWTRNGKKLVGHTEEKLSSITSKGLGTLAKKFGITKENKIQISKEIEKASSDFYCGFISGLFDADGTVNCGKDKSIRLWSINYEFLTGVQRMLSRLGIISNVYFEREKSGIKEICGRVTKCKAGHELRISKQNIDIFNEKIGFKFSDKQNKLNKILGSNRRKEKFGCTISSIVYRGKEEVFDCTIPEIEAFDANGIYVHNCPQGSPMSSVGNDLQIQSTSNCFVIEVGDSYGWICHADQEMSHIYRRRGGVGLDISKIRPKGMSTANAAKTTDGIIPFMEQYSSTTRRVAMGNRRGALMMTISVHHPEIMSFIKAKSDLEKVTGANISIRVSDEFMNAVKNNEDFELRWPVDEKENPKISNKIKARKIWDELIDSNWNSAEPGILYWDQIIKQSPTNSYEDFIPTSTNPCSELPLVPYDSCRLMILNLFGFIKNPFEESAYFDFDLFKEYSKKAQRLMDDLVDLELESIDKILNKVKLDPESDNIKKIEIDLWNKVKKKCLEGRRTGLGITGLGDTLAALGIRYGSKESISMTEEIYKNLALSAYRASVDMGDERGAFPAWDWNKEKDNLYLNKIFNEDKELMKDNKKHGRRNIAILTTAPAGSVSCLTQTTSGVEPVFLLSYTRRRKINGNNEDEQVDFIDDLGDKWQEYKVYHHHFKTWMNTSGKTEVKKSPYHKSTTEDIDWLSSVELQASATKWIDHSLSKTCNLPKDVSKELVSEIYMKAWELGCKGFTIYRDGSRSGVLVKDGEEQTIKKQHAPKRLESLSCDIHRVKIKGEEWTIFVGLLNGDPFEIFGGLSNTIEIPKKYKEGRIIKRSFKSGGKYDLILGDGDEEMKVKDLVKVFDNPNHSAFTRLLSLSMRHGAPIIYVVEQLLRDSEADMHSFAKVMARVLKKYIVDGVKRDRVCGSCGSSEMAYQEGCLTCMSCGYAKCG